jgi:arylsulfatase A-like enzyme
MSRRLNVLWIQTDEQQPDTLGCYGSAWARTPHVDRIARRGKLFGRVDCQSPIENPELAFNWKEKP